MKWRIVFATAMGDTTLDSFECEIGTLSRFIGKAGDLEGAIPITNFDIGARASLILGGAGRLTMYAYFGEQCWWGGFLDNTRLVSTPNGSALTFSGSTFESYLDRRECRTDVAKKGLEQTEYARLLWRYVQDSGPGSNLLINTDFAPMKTKSRDMSWMRSEARKVGAVLKEISNREGGFEWIIDTYEDQGQRRRALTVGYPQIGRPSTAATLTFPGNILSYEIEADALDGATSFQARGKAPDPVGSPGTQRGVYDKATGTTTLVGEEPKGSEKTYPIMSQEFHSDNFLQTGYVRFDQTVERDTVTEVDTLNKWAELARATRSGPLVLPQVKARLAGFEQNILGSNVQLRIRDFAHPQGAYGEPGYNKVARVIGYEIDPGEFGAEDTVRLIFEDPTDDDHLERSPI